MWKIVFHYTYSDFELDKGDIELCASLIETFENNVHYAVKQLLITTSATKCCQVPGTEKQRDSSVWFQERWSRITASGCKEVVKLLLDHNNEGYKQRLFNWQ